MNALDRKLARDLWHMKGQALAITLVITSGVATFVMSLATLQSLRQSQIAYYERYRFAHVFAQLKRAPNSLAIRIAQIPGVAQVQTRVVSDVNLDIEGMAEPAVGRLISIPDRPTPGLNQPHLRHGRYIEPGRNGEVLLGEAFAEAHGLAPGDSVRAVINGRLQELRIVGIVLSPEYVIQIRGGDMLPDDRRFGVFWMGRTELATAFDMEGAFNDVTVRFMRGASEPEVIQRLDNLIEPYGGIGAFGREDQVSNRYLSDEIKQLRSMGLVAPAIFLSVAAFLLNVVISRLISTQREQIAALKAFGYSNREVGGHYLKLVLSITVLGVVLGIVVGAWLGRNLTSLYTEFYRFPVLGFHLRASVVALAFLISVGAAVLGTLAAVRRAVKLPPAEAMRPEPPTIYRPTIIERTGLQALLSQAARMILRQLERRPLKALLSTFGIALAVAVLVLGNFMEDSLDYIMHYQFNLVQRYDLSIAMVEPTLRPPESDTLPLPGVFEAEPSYSEPTSGRAFYEIRHLPGVLHAEAFRSLSTRFRFGHRSRRVAIMGLEPEGKLYRLVEEGEKYVSLPPDGLVLSSKLAELLAVEVGQTVTIEVLEGERPVRQVPVVGLVKEYGGTNAYMDVRAVRRLMREQDSLSGAFLAVDGNTMDELYATLKATPGVASVTVKTAALRSFEETVAENLLRMRAINIIFASIIAFGVVYNSARISLSERSRELATLRVIGFTRAEISAILLGELAVLTLAAIPLGLLLGYSFAALATLGLDTELYRIPLVVDRSTFAFAATVTIIAALLSGLVVRSRLDHLDLVAVLKTRE